MRWRLAGQGEGASGPGKAIWVYRVNYRQRQRVGYVYPCAAPDPPMTCVAGAYTPPHSEVFAQLRAYWYFPPIGW